MTIPTAPARQTEWTQLTAGCGHSTAARLSVDAEQAAVEIGQLMNSVCIPCAKADRLSTSGILWADLS